jgi:hypothetical protein
LLNLKKNRALTDEELTGMYGDRYDPSDIREALSEIHGLESAGQLFTEDIYKNAVIDFKNRPTVRQGTLPEYRARLQSGVQVLFRGGRRISRKTGAHEL